MNRFAAALIAAGLIAAPGSGGVLGDLVGAKSATAEFAGTWTVAGASSEIDHIVVTASGSGPVRIQVFGRCEARVCNWGALPARIRTDGPTSETVRALAADYNLGFALQHLTLHRVPGAALQFDMVTEFTDGSDRHDFETSGKLVPAGTAAASAAPAAQQPAAQPAASPAAEPAAITPPAPAVSAKAGSGISNLNPLNWFGDKPAAAPSAAPSMAIGAASAAPVDDCFAIDTGHVYLTNNNSNWLVRDFLHVVQNFGPYRVAADKGMKIIGFYRFDEICRIGRGNTNMSFFRTAGEVPHQPMGGDDCTDVKADKVVAVLRDDEWVVADGDRALLKYGSDKDGAVQAASVIRALNLSHQCFYDRANLAASYWLSR